jgi:hypothetical protein
VVPAALAPVVTVWAALTDVGGVAASAAAVFDESDRSFAGVEVV